MAVAMAAAAAAAGPAAGFAGRGGIAATGRREGGKFLVQLRRAAMRAFCPAPVGGANQDFAVAFALPAMKFVNRHGQESISSGEKFKHDYFPTTAPSGQFPLMGDLGNPLDGHRCHRELGLM